MDERSARVDRWLAAERRRRRWMLALGLTPLVAAGTIVGLLELGGEVWVIPVAVGWSALGLVELAMAIEAGLAVNAAAAALAADLGRDP